MKYLGLCQFDHINRLITLSVITLIRFHFKVVLNRPKRLKTFPFSQQLKDTQTERLLNFLKRLLSLADNVEDHVTSKFSSGQECLKECLGASDCLWFSFNKVSSVCTIFKEENTCGKPRDGKLLKKRKQ